MGFAMKLAELARQRAVQEGIVQPALVGLVVGATWAALLFLILCTTLGSPGSSAKDWGEILYYLLPFPLGFALTAVVVYHLGPVPELVGAAAALLIMFAAAIVAAQSLLAVGILIPAYAVSAFLCGPIIGLLMRLRMRQRTSPPVAHAGEESCGGSETRLGSRVRTFFVVAILLVAAALATALVWGYWSESERQRERSVEIDRVATAAGLVGNHSTCLVGDGIELSFRGHHVDDAKLQHLAGLPLIIALDLSDTQITDAGLPAIADLTRLDYLQLGNTAITDRGLECLSRLKNLQALDLAGTRVTQPGPSSSNASQSSGSFTQGEPD
jgi:hypothetical protein